MYLVGRTQERKPLGEQSHLLEMYILTTLINLFKVEGAGLRHVLSAFLLFTSVRHSQQWAVASRTTTNAQTALRRRLTPQ